MGKIDTPALETALSHVRAKRRRLFKTMLAGTAAVPLLTSTLLANDGYIKGEKADSYIRSEKSTPTTTTAAQTIKHPKHHKSSNAAGKHPKSASKTSEKKSPPKGIFEG